MAQRTFIRRAWYSAVRVACWLMCVVWLRLRCEGREHLPRDGGVLVLSNHQSHLDPILVGVACDRQLSAMARDTLFDKTWVRLLIRSLNAFPIERDGASLSGLKETLRRLRQGEAVLVFPEGTRSPDGKLQSLKPGIAVLARRAKVPLLPVAIEGAYQSWPRRARFPRPTVVRVQMGPPLLPDELEQFSDEELLAEVERRIRACKAQANEQRMQALGRNSDAER